MQAHNENPLLLIGAFLLYPLKHDSFDTVSWSWCVVRDFYDQEFPKYTESIMLKYLSDWHKTVHAKSVYKNRFKIQTKWKYILHVVLLL